MEKLSNILGDPGLMAKAAAQETVEELNKVLAPVVAELDRIIQAVDLSRFFLLQVGACTVFERALVELKRRVENIKGSVLGSGGNGIQQ